MVVGQFVDVDVDDDNVTVDCEEIVDVDADGGHWADNDDLFYESFEDIEPEMLLIAVFFHWNHDFDYWLYDYSISRHSFGYYY